MPDPAGRADPGSQASSRAPERSASAGDPIQEGATWLFPPATNLQVRGPGTRDKEAFYNPAMALNRDLSLLLADAWADHRGRGLDVADALAGTGARSLRWATECESDLVVHANDGDPSAIQAIRRGMKANGITEDFHVHEGLAHAFLATRRFDVIDIDPYGPPTPFLDAAMMACRHDGLVCLTATDTAALAGTYPRVTRRRYGAWHGLHRVAWRSEVGLRILAATAIRAAGRHDRTARPVLSVAQGHWMRVVMHVRDGKRDADAGLRGCGYLTADDAHGPIACRDPLDLADHRHLKGDAWAGPVWLGPLHDEALVADMVRRAEAAAGAGRPASGPGGPHDGPHLAHPDTRRLLAALQDEAGAPLGWLDPSHLQKVWPGDAPRRAAWMQALQEAGYQATRNHLDPQGVRTDAPLEAARLAWSSQQKHV